MLVWALKNGGCRILRNGGWGWKYLVFLEKLGVGVRGFGVLGNSGKI